MKKQCCFWVLFLAIVVFVLYFLRRMGTNLIVSLAIPISICGYFSILMFFNGLSLNIMNHWEGTGASGRVCSSIMPFVVIESIFRNQEKGIEYQRGCYLNGTAEVANAVIASTPDDYCRLPADCFLSSRSFRAKLFKRSGMGRLLFSLVFFFVCGYPGDFRCLYNPAFPARRFKLEEVKVPFVLQDYSRVLRKLIQRRWLGDRLWQC